MGPTLSNQEITRQIKELRDKIGDAKASIKAEFRNFGKVSKDYTKATTEYKKAKAAYDKKPKAKQEKKLDMALDKFYQAHDEYKAVYKLIDSYFVTIEEDYNDIFDLSVAVRHADTDNPAAEIGYIHRCSVGILKMPYGDFFTCGKLAERLGCH